MTRSSWELVCPKCRVTLDVATEPLRCACCQVTYPSVGGARCLVPSPEAFLQLELARYAQYRVTVHERTQALLAAAGLPQASARTNARLMHIVRGFMSELSCLDGLFAPMLAIAQQQSLADVEPRLDEPLAATRYSEHLFRDWVWGEAELGRTLSLLAPQLTGSIQRLAVLGAGTARLAFDLARHASVGEVVALDLNPLPFLVTDRLLRGEPVDLIEFPLVPRQLEHTAIARRLEPPAVPVDNLRLVWADAVWLPFTDGSLDVVVTPWFIDVVDADCRNAQVRLGRKQIFVVQHEGRAEIVDGANKREQAPGDEARQHQRQRDPAKQPQPVTSHVLRHLFEGWIDIRERHRRVEHDERKKVQRLDENYASKPFHERDADVEPAHQQKVDRAAATQEELQGYRADERRDHQR